MRINTNGWKEFRIGDLFTIEKTKGKNSTHLEEGNDIPYIGASRYNNGVQKYCLVEGHEDEVSEGNALIFVKQGDAAAGVVHYFPDAFIGSSTVCIGRSERLTSNIGNYIAAVITQTNSGKYNFSNGLTEKKIADLKILLPITIKEEPDWEYMESYMASVMGGCRTQFEYLLKFADEPHKMDVGEWGKFRVGDLFDVSTSKSVDKIKLNFDKNGNYDFVGRTPINNGIQGKLHRLDFEPNKAGTFSVTQIGERLCQYRENAWYASQNIFVLNPLMDEILKSPFFITTILTEMLKRIYGDDAYSIYPTLKTLPNDIILLPITSFGEPNWQYMEEFMQTTIDKQKNILQSFSRMMEKSYCSVE